MVREAGGEEVHLRRALVGLLFRVHASIDFRDILIRRLAGNVEIQTQADGDGQITHAIAAVPFSDLPMHAPAHKLPPLFVGFRKQDEELITPVADDIIGATHARFQDGGNLREHVVTHQVAVSIIDPFEVVQVAHDERQRAIGALGSGDFTCHEVPQLNLATIGPIDSQT